MHLKHLRVIFLENYLSDGILTSMIFFIFDQLKELNKR